MPQRFYFKKNPYTWVYWKFFRYGRDTRRLGNQRIFNGKYERWSIEIWWYPIGVNGSTRIRIHTWRGKHWRNWELVLFKRSFRYNWSWYGNRTLSYQLNHKKDA